MTSADEGPSFLVRGGGCDGREGGLNVRDAAAAGAYAVQTDVTESVGVFCSGKRLAVCNVERVADDS